MRIMLWLRYDLEGFCLVGLLKKHLSIGEFSLEEEEAHGCHLDILWIAFTVGEELCSPSVEK